MHAYTPLVFRPDDDLGTLRQLTVRMLEAAASGDHARLAHLRATRDTRLEALATEVRGGTPGGNTRRA